jgi:hypothetical protein
MNVVVIYVDWSQYWDKARARICSGEAAASFSKCKGIRLFEFSDLLDDGQVCDKVLAAMTRKDVDTWFEHNPDVRDMHIGDRVKIQRTDDRGHARDKCYRLGQDGWVEELPII